jgi:hypothetical protein
MVLRFIQSRLKSSYSFALAPFRHSAESVSLSFKRLQVTFIPLEYIWSLSVIIVKFNVTKLSLRSAGPIVSTDV